MDKILSAQRRAMRHPLSLSKVSPREFYFCDQGHTFKCLKKNNQWTLQKLGQPRIRKFNSLLELKSYAGIN